MARTYNRRHPGSRMLSCALPGRRTASGSHFPLIATPNGPGQKWGQAQDTTQDLSIYLIQADGKGLRRLRRGWRHRRFSQMVGRRQTCRLLRIKLPVNERRPITNINPATTAQIISIDVTTGIRRKLPRSRAQAFSPNFQRRPHWISRESGPQRRARPWDCLYQRRRRFCGNSAQSVIVP